MVNDKVKEITDSETMVTFHATVQRRNHTPSHQRPFEIFLPISITRLVGQGDNS